MSKPVLAVGLLATMVGAWYWALLPPAQLVVSRRPVSPMAAARPLADVPAVRLGDLAVEAASRPLPDDRRNPFANGVSVARGSTAGTGGRGAAAAAIAAPEPSVPSWPRLDLIGVAEARVGGGIVRTGILSGPRGVQHVQAGDVVAGVYRVERIGADGIDVRLIPEQRVVRFTLPF